MFRWPFKRKRILKPGETADILWLGMNWRVTIVRRIDHGPWMDAEYETQVNERVFATFSAHELGAR